jgi:alpha-glucosidase
MEDALDYYQKIGIKGIKVDFMERDDQYMVEFYHRTAKECAKRKILVNFHGAYKPDGLERTYPNIITREAVLGNEYARWITGLPDPKHNVTIPFTRMVTGGMDYTPGSMLNSTEEAFVGRWNDPMTKGTRAQQLAMLVVYESGLITLCESPKIYENLPELNFIKQVPASWDSTIVLDGKIGRFIAIARKKGDNWFIGVMTGSRERNIEISFSFLSDGIWSAEIYSDSPDADLNPQNVSIGQTNVLRSNVKQFHMAKGGGLAMILKPLR